MEHDQEYLSFSETSADEYDYFVYKVKKNRPGGLQIDNKTNKYDSSLPQIEEENRSRGDVSIGRDSYSSTNLVDKNGGSGMFKSSNLNKGIAANTSD